MNSKTNTSPWVLCPSKTFPGNFYYFNVSTGETAWGLGDAEKSRNSGLLKVSGYHCHPEPQGPPTASDYNVEPFQHSDPAEDVLFDQSKFEQPYIQPVLEQPVFGQPIFAQSIFSQPKPAIIENKKPLCPIQIQIPVPHENVTKLAPKDLLVQTLKNDQPKPIITFGQDLKLVQTGSTFGKEHNLVQNSSMFGPGHNLFQSGTIGQEHNLVLQSSTSQGLKVQSDSRHLVQSKIPTDPRIKPTVAKDVEGQTYKPLCQRFVNYEPPIITFNKDNKLENKLDIDKIFTSTPVKSQVTPTFNSNFQKKCNLSFSNLSAIKTNYVMKPTKKLIKEPVFVIEVEPSKITKTPVERKSNAAGNKVAFSLGYNEWLNNHPPNLVQTGNGAVEKKAPVEKYSAFGNKKNEPNLKLTEKSYVSHKEIVPFENKSNGFGNKVAISSSYNDWLKNVEANFEKSSKSDGTYKKMVPVENKSNLFENNVNFSTGHNESIKNYAPNVDQTEKSNSPEENKSNGFKNMVAYSMGHNEWASNVPHLGQIRNKCVTSEKIASVENKTNGLRNKVPFSMSCNENVLSKFEPKLKQTCKIHEDQLLPNESSFGGNVSFTMNQNVKWITNYVPNIEQTRINESGKEMPPVENNSKAFGNNVAFPIDKSDKKNQEEPRPMKSMSNIANNTVGFLMADARNISRSCDLRSFLTAKRRTVSEGNAKRPGIITHTNQVKPTVKKKVSFNPELDTVSFSPAEYEDENSTFKTQHGPTVHALNSANPHQTDQWCIAVDTETLLEEFAFLEEFVRIDPKCKLLIPSKVVSEISAISIGDFRSRSTVMVARNVIRRLPSDYITLQSADDDSSTSTNEGILQCCRKIIHHSHLVLIASNVDLLKTAKLNSIQCYTIQQIKDGVPKHYQKSPKLPFKITIPNEAVITESVTEITKLTDDDLNEKEKEIIKNLVRNSNEGIPSNCSTIRDSVCNAKVSTENPGPDGRMILSYDEDIFRIKDEKEPDNILFNYENHTHNNGIGNKKNTDLWYSYTEDNLSNEKTIVKDKKSDWVYGSIADFSSNESRTGKQEKNNFRVADVEENPSNEKIIDNGEKSEWRYGFMDGFALNEKKIEHDFTDRNKSDKKSREPVHLVENDADMKNRNMIDKTDFNRYTKNSELKHGSNKETVLSNYLQYKIPKLGTDEKTVSPILQKKIPSLLDMRIERPAELRQKSHENELRNPLKYKKPQDIVTNDSFLNAKSNLVCELNKQETNKFDEEEYHLTKNAKRPKKLNTKEIVDKLNQPEQKEHSQTTYECGSKEYLFTEEKKPPVKKKNLQISNDIETKEYLFTEEKNQTPIMKKLQKTKEFETKEFNEISKEPVLKGIIKKRQYDPKGFEMPKISEILNSHKTNEMGTKKFEDEKNQPVRKNNSHSRKINEHDTREVSTRKEKDHPAIKIKLQKTNDKTNFYRVVDDKQSTMSKLLNNNYETENNRDKSKAEFKSETKNVYEMNEFGAAKNQPVTNKEVDTLDNDEKKELPEVEYLDLRSFHVKNEVVENRLKDRMDEWVCSYTQIMEEMLSSVLEKLPSNKLKSTAPWTMYEALHCIKIAYKDHTINTLVDDLCGFLYEKSYKQDKIKPDLKPADYIKAFGCGVNLVKCLMKTLHDQDKMLQGEMNLLDLLNRIEDPLTDVIEPMVYAPVTHTDKQLLRQNFVKTRSEIICYLKKHYSDWKVYEDSNFKVIRTCGKDPIALKFDTKLSEQETVIIKTLTKADSLENVRMIDSKKTNDCDENQHLSPEVIAEPENSLEKIIASEKNACDEFHPSPEVMKPKRGTDNPHGNDKMIDGFKTNDCDKLNLSPVDSNDCDDTKMILKIRNEFDNADKFRSQKDLVCNNGLSCSNNTELKVKPKMRGMKITIANDYKGNSNKTEAEKDEETIKIHDETKNYTKIIRNAHPIKEFEERLKYLDGNIDNERSLVIKENIQHNSDATLGESKNYHFEKNNADTKAVNDRKNDNASANDSPKAYAIMKSFSTELSSSLELINQFVEGSIQEFHDGRIQDSTKKMFRFKAFEANFLITKIISKLKKVLLDETRHRMTDDEEMSGDKQELRYIQVVTTCLDQALVLHKTLNVVLLVTNNEYCLSDRSGHSSMSINMS